MQKPDIHRLLELQKLWLQFSQIERVTHRKHGDAYIRETDTEHSYNLAMTAWYLAAHFPDLDRDTLIRYALIHDLVEVHAGDTYIYGDQSSLDSKTEREAAALRTLESDWADFPEMLSSIHTYEKHESEEAKFVYALDKIMPIMQIYLAEGHTWQQEGITPERLDSVKRPKVQVSPQILPYYEQLFELLITNRHLFG